MSEERIIRVKCTKCHQKIENNIKNRFCLPLKGSFKFFSLCSKHQEEYLDIIKEVQSNKESKVEEFLYATSV